jgi:hypothetical protein
LPSLPVQPIFASSVDVRILRSFAASAKQQDQLNFGRHVINPIALSNVDPHFPNSIAAKLVIAKIAQLHPVDSPVNGNLRCYVPGLAPPFDEYIPLALSQVMANLIRAPIVVYKRIAVNHLPIATDL